jgi:hypothetical protein
VGIATGDVVRAASEAAAAGAAVIAEAGAQAGRPQAMLTDTDGIPLELVTST